jgi:hypothetical protein
MDGDGEDSPTDIRRLIECYDSNGAKRVVFALRQRRSEGALFQVFYQIYRAIHWLLTGVSVRIGNFSLIPSSHLHRLVVVSDIWNHYAAGVVKARVPIAHVPTSRASRLTGRPKMNFTSLVVHGLSAISVFRDRLGVRLLVAASSVTVLILLGLFSFGFVHLQAGATWPRGSVLLAVAGVAYLIVNLFISLTLFAFDVLKRAGLHRL